MTSQDFRDLLCQSVSSAEAERGRRTETEAGSTIAVRIS